MVAVAASKQHETPRPVPAFAPCVERGASPRNISTSRPRRRRDSSPRNIRVAAAAATRLSRHGVAATRAVGSRAGDASFYEIEFSANKDLCRRLDIKKLPCVQFFRGAEGCVATVMCGPSKFPEVREKLVELLGDEVHGDDVPEFTDVSEHYKSKSGDAQPDAQPV